jgi:hypothetical protein
MSNQASTSICYRCWQLTFASYCQQVQLTLARYLSIPNVFGKPRKFINHFPFPLNNSSSSSDRRVSVTSPVSVRGVITDNTQTIPLSDAMKIIFRERGTCLLFCVENKTDEIWNTISILLCLKVDNITETKAKLWCWPLSLSSKPSSCVWSADITQWVVDL